MRLTTLAFVLTAPWVVLLSLAETKPQMKEQDSKKELEKKLEEKAHEKLEEELKGKTYQEMVSVIDPNGDGMMTKDEMKTSMAYTIRVSQTAMYQELKAMGGHQLSQDEINQKSEIDVTTIMDKLWPEVDQLWNQRVEGDGLKIEDIIVQDKESSKGWRYSESGPLPEFNGFIG